MQQLLFWAGQKLRPQEAIFQIGGLCVISGEIDALHFISAFQAALASSDALRTVIEEVDGVPYSRTLDRFEYEMDCIDLSQEADAQASLTDWSRKRMREVMTIGSRLFDSALLKLSDCRFAWFLSQHHLICDAWSLALTFERTLEFYKQSKNGGISDMNQLPFADYAAFERGYRESPRYREAEAYWKAHTAKESAPLKFYGVSAQTTTTEVVRESCELSPETVDKLVAKAKNSEMFVMSTDASLSNIFLVLAFALLHRITGSRSICIGVAIHNRRNARFKQTMGMFMQFVPIRITFEEGESFSVLAERIKRRIVEAVRFGSYCVPNSISHRAYDVVFNYITARYTDFDGAPVVVEWLHTGNGAEVLAFHVQDMNSSGRFKVSFDFNREVFDEEKRDHIIRTFIRVVEAFLDNPSCSLTSDSLLLADEYQKSELQLQQEMTFDFAQ